jgi:diacylglycerol kinase (ATP)
MKEQPIQRAKFIYNPHAGEKRRLNPMQKKVALEDVKALLEQYQIPVDPTPTKYPKHATELAKDSIKEGYKTVIVAGGDGTVGEVINGLVGSDVVIGILPLGSVMNNARMFGIPLELEKAVELIKIRRERKIDVGGITKLNGEKMEETYYFTEQSGIGFDAIMHYYTSTLFDKNMII